MPATRVWVVRRSDRSSLYLRWNDPITGKVKQRSAHTKAVREAERCAARLEAELLSDLNPVRTKHVTWTEFRDTFKAEKLPGLAKKTVAAYNVALNHLAHYLAPRLLVEVTSERLSELQKHLRDRGNAETSIATHLRHIRAALNWAEDVGMLGSAPKVRLPRRGKNQKVARSRPITPEEYARMLAQAAKTRPNDHWKWEWLLEGLWLSGLRLKEAVAVSWDEDASLRIIEHGEHLFLRIHADGEKGHQNRLLPLAPDFQEALRKRDREGHVFPLESQVTGFQMTAMRAGRIVTKIGRQAGVIVDAQRNKPASSHDFRRAFATRWATRVMPAVLMQLLRHESIETSMRYYVEVNAEAIAAQLQARKGQQPHVG